MGRSSIRNSEYRVHQVGTKDSASQNFNSLAIKRNVVGVTQILLTSKKARTKFDAIERCV
jgi:hypothetical protein